jgi:DNA (cytosine-5)-methyltransferase 1
VAKEGEMTQLTCGSLFAGIGGFDLGFERAGIKTIWQVEIDDYCRRVLAKHFPEAERFGDIRDCGAHNLKPVDIVCGGFPCQPFSTSGKRLGSIDDRYLWPEMLRVVRDCLPRWVIAENVAGIAHEFDWVLEALCDDLEAEGYEVFPPLMVPACAFGSPHRRDRVWVFAHRLLGDAGSQQAQQQTVRAKVSYRNAWWTTEPEVDRVVHGFPGRMALDRALGNAVVPQIAEWIGRRIIEAELVERAVR